MCFILLWIYSSYFSSSSAHRNRPFCALLCYCILCNLYWFNHRLDEVNFIISQAVLGKELAVDVAYAATPVDI